MALLGLCVGIVGMHRFYLGLYVSGMLQTLLFFTGVMCFALGFVHVVGPFLLELSANKGNISALSAAVLAKELIDERHELWFISGSLLCLASLCWLVTDCIVMSDLVERNR